MKNTAYYPATDSGDEMIEFQVEDEIYGTTICVVDVKEMLSGRYTFPCGSGADYTLSVLDFSKLLRLIKRERGSSDVEANS